MLPEDLAGSPVGADGRDRDAATPVVAAIVPAETAGHWKNPGEPSVVPEEQHLPGKVDLDPGRLGIRDQGGGQIVRDHRISNGLGDPARPGHAVDLLEGDHRVVRLLIEAPVDRTGVITKICQPLLYRLDSRPTGTDAETGCGERDRDAGGDGVESRRRR